MNSGFFSALITGLIWSVAGIVISRCAEERFSLGFYSFFQTLFAGILSLAVFGKFTGFVWSKGVVLLCGTVFLAGIFNATAQFFVRLAMKNGNHAPIWAMMQCCMLFPFLAGILIFREQPDLMSVCGMFLMIGGILFPCIKGWGNVKGYLAYAFVALLLFGLAQILYLVCSCSKIVADPAGLRPALTCFGNMAAWGILIRLDYEKWQFSNRILFLALLMALVSTGGLFFFFRALDLLSCAGKGNIAVPLIMGTNIGVFSLYSRFNPAQKNTVADICSVLSILAGLFCFALGGR